MKIIKIFAITGFFVLFVNLLSAQSPTPSSAVIQVNKVKATVQSNGALFWDNSQGQFIAPYLPGQPGISTMKSSGLWLAGIDNTGQYHGAIQMYNQGGKSDFEPGLILEDGTVYPLEGIFRVSKTDIQQHLSGTPNDNVLGWPARGNPYFFSIHGYDLPFDFWSSLAGFSDEDSNGSYNPGSGDYPSIDVRGCPGVLPAPDEMLWFSFHDKTTHTQSGMLPMNMEVQALVMAYTCSEESPLNNTVFVRYKLINRSDQELFSCYFGVFADFDIGNPNDDFMGAYKAKSLLYGYNGDVDDEGGYGSQPPAMALDLLRGPLDTFGNELGMKHAIPLPAADFPDPVYTPEQFHNLLRGCSPAGVLMANNGMPYYNNPNFPNIGSEVQAGNTPGNRVTLASFGPFGLKPGAYNEIIIAYTFYQNSGNSALQNVQAMYDNNAKVQGFFDACFTDWENLCIVPVGEQQLPTNTGLVIAPNPATEYARITLPATLIGEKYTLELLDVQGRVVRRINGHDAEVEIRLDGMQEGIYFLKVKSDSHVLTGKLVLKPAGI